MNMNSNDQIYALIYCRVSDRKQLEGSGLESQEHRCRQHAFQKGYEVETVFLDNISGGSDLMARPAMLNLLNYLHGQTDTGKQYVVVFDDHKRFARHTETHLALHRKLNRLGAKVEYLNFAIEDTPEGKFFDTLLAAQAQLEREQMGRQTKQKTKARLEQGYWAFKAPIGYKYVKSAYSGKELVRDEPVASVIQEALEGFATGLFSTQSEVKQFLEANPHYPSDLKTGEIRPQTVVRLLTNPLYAGFVEAKKWGISRRKGNHKPLITLETFEAIAQRRKKPAKVPLRKDTRRDFPLRGAVNCSCCAAPLTAGWSKGKYKHYAYYLCHTRTCDMYGKSIPRDKLEGMFADYLKTLQPAQPLFDLFRALLKDGWNNQANLIKQDIATLKQQHISIDKEIDSLLTRIVDTSSPRVIQAYEQKIDQLEKDKLLITKKTVKLTKPRRTFEQMFELSMTFLSNPYKLWVSGKFELQRLVLKLAFPERFEYSLATGLRTPKSTISFNMLGSFFDEKSKMVP